MKYAWGNLTDRILAALRDDGPMVGAEIARHVGDPDVEKISKICRRMTARKCGNGPQKGQLRMHICGWRWDAEGVRRYPRPEFKFGPGQNRPRPEPTGDQRRIERNDGYRIRAQRLKASSIFRLAVPEKVLRAGGAP